MKQREPTLSWGSFGGRSRRDAESPLAAQLLHVVDFGLAATVCVAPFVFGGRHDLGRLVFVTLTAVTAVAWFLRQSLLPKAFWTRTAAHLLILSATALVVLQLVPLPANWIADLAPRVSELLPLWTSGAASIQLGTWNTLSLTPHETTLALAMLLSYALLFLVLTQRIQTVSDVERLLNLVAFAAVLMAGFGLLQYFFSNGRFFWCYEHPFRTTDQYVTGSFMNRNHFAGFLVLGIGPLARWLISTLRDPTSKATRRTPAAVDVTYIPVLLLVSSVTVTLLAIALSLSRGGAIALFAAAAVLSVIYLRWRLVDAKYLYGLVGLAMLLIGILSIYGYDKVTARLDDLVEGSVEAVDRGEGRRTVWAANVTAIQQGGVTGSGAGSHQAICPVYLTVSTPQHYSHAENGYLQIATENGWIGAGLLLAAFVLCGGWSLVCLGRLTNDAERLCFGAAAAGLAASAVHSLVDFVWYIPACMSVTILLAACVLRLAQFGLAEAERPARSWQLSRPRWIELALPVLLAGGWTIYAYVGPAMASIHWDRYLRASRANTRLAYQQLSALNNRQPKEGVLTVEPLSDLMIEHLEQVVTWDPQFADAHLRLAGKYVARFELAQQDGSNSMPLGQIRDAALSSNFSTPQERKDWLQRAFGENAQLLFRAYDHARRAAALSPLKGEAYLYLANLCFLEQAERPIIEAYIDQGLRVRPSDGDVLFEVGMQNLILTGQFDKVFPYWAKCFGDTGGHQLRIVQTLAGQMPAEVFISVFKPDWRTLREIWIRYRRLDNPQDLNLLVAYAANVTKQQVEQQRGIPPAYIWLWQSEMYTDVGKPEEALACLDQAYRSGAHIYAVRYALGWALMNAQRYVEAEAHIRWCRARRPEAKELFRALEEITKHRVAQHTAESEEPNGQARSWNR
jgi:tetratricopeptide (TPR) repeat protein